MSSMSTQQAPRNVITLAGSAQIVVEFFKYAVSSILFQRQIYPPDEFKGIRQYGMQVMVTSNPGLQKYLSEVGEQMRVWVAAGQLQRLVLVVLSTATGAALERWTFNIVTDKAVLSGNTRPPAKSEREISREIAAIIRQITSSITFLPLIEEACTFDVLVHTDTDAAVPAAWGDTRDPGLRNPCEVALRSFSTKVHTVAAAVAYRQDDGDEADA